MPYLPHYRGKYTVGFIDVEAESSQDIGVFMRIFYPTTDDQRKKAYSSSWLPNYWRYSRGYGAFLKLSSFLSAILVYPVLSLISLPCVEFAPVLKEEVPEKLPVAIFSHGLGGARTTYSNICGNLASRGMIVVAIEHGDGSACVTARSGNIHIPYEHPDIDNLKDGETKESYGVKFRSSQLAHRCTEVKDVIESLKHLSKGEMRERQHADFDVAKAETHKMTLQSFRGKLDFNNMALIGHSFGAATSINYLKDGGDPFKCAVLLDPWMYAVDPTAKVTIPVLNLQSHRFHWKSNLDAIQKIAHLNDPIYQFAYIKETRHQDASDLTLVYPKLMRLAKNGGENPKEVHELQDNLIFSFISKHIKVTVPPSEPIKTDRVVYGGTAFSELYEMENY